MVGRWFGSEGTVITYLNKIGSILLLNLLFIVCSIPIITIGSSLTSFYYAMVKTVRRERSYPAREFFHSMKRTFISGSIVTLLLCFWGYILYINREYSGGMGKGISITMVLAYDLIAIITLGIILYLFPVISRFQMKLLDLLKLSFVMAIRHLPYTILLAAGAAICGLLLWYLPVPFILVIPGFYCYASTFVYERILKKYMPKPKEGEDAWYYE